jgi:hypothetical protein
MLCRDLRVLLSEQSNKGLYRDYYTCAMCLGNYTTLQLAFLKCHHLKVWIKHLICEAGNDSSEKNCWV